MLIFVGNGIAQLDRNDFFTKQSGYAVIFDERVFDAPPLHSILENDIYLQNLPSILVSYILDPKPGEIILDMCSAPGGKTTHIASLMNNQGRVIAFDKNEKKVQQVRQLCQKFGLSIVEIHCCDSSSILRKIENNEERISFEKETFDRVLVDPPCSGFGLRPCLGYDKYLFTEKQIKAVSLQQKKLIEVGVKLLKMRGILVYSTCTMNPKENEEIVSWILNKCKENDCEFYLELVSQEPFHYSNSSMIWQNNYEMQLNQQQLNLLQRFDPANQLLDTNGFFIAKFVKLPKVNN
eukprot:TRINITY_DN2354_c0_g2_i3.p1 TRINITY_DN2354_c0_g2~~TRINITY_DN2354_c0_g2_i3.p1  ORF type:complete len:293 (-),score=116.96 TRINITY_DN2354_c0_g2_i3:23-901(-)